MFSVTTPAGRREDPVMETAIANNGCMVTTEPVVGLK